MKEIMLCLFLTASLLSGDTIPFYSRVTVVDGEAKVGQEFNLAFTLKALMDLPETRILFEVPNGIKLVDGTPIRTIYPHSGDSIAETIWLRILFAGPYQITVHTILAPSDTISILQHYAKDFYIISSQDSVIYSKNPEDSTEYNLIADVALGRFSVWTNEQLSRVIEKLFSFERYPNAGEWFIKRNDLVSYFDEEYRACKIESIVPIITAPPYLFQYYDDFGGWTSNEVLKSHINNHAGPTPQKGSSLLNYRGHGFCEEWPGWNYLGESFTNDDIYSLTNFVSSNNAWLPIVFEICCCCGRAGVAPPHQTGHSEAWFRHENGGGVAALGATRPSWTQPNHKFDAELYRVSFGPTTSPYAPIQELGWTINYAKIEMANAYGWTDEVKDNVRMNYLMGDPEIDIYTGWNGYICATHDRRILIGPQQFLVRVYDSDETPPVPLPGAFVCLYKENDIFQTKYTDMNGEALFDISPLTIGTMYVTATKHDYGPYEGACLVIAEDAGSKESKPTSYSFSFKHASYLPQSNSVNISYQLPEASFVEISVFDIMGRLVKTVEKGLREKGINRDIWNCQNESNRKISKGIYFIRLKNSENELIKKVVIF